MNDDTDRTALGARLKNAREYAGFSQEEVASYLKISRSAVSLLESGARRVDALELKRLATLYQRSMEELTDQEQPPPDNESVKMVARAAQMLSPEDQSEVLRFAQFLRQRKSGSREPQK